MVFQPPVNRPRPPQPQSQQNFGWRDAYTSFHQDLQRLSLPGFYISSPQDILPRDVPMDGSISFFPSNDLSYIIIKQWTGNGTIADAKYVLEPKNQPPAQAQGTQPTQVEDDTTTQKDSEISESSNNSEIVEVISAALNEQTQRLTAAFSQIGNAFNVLQQKMDVLSSPPASRATAFTFPDTAEDGSPEEKTKQSRPKTKELKDGEKS